MGILDSFKPKPTLSEMEEENQKLDVEYSNLQKKVMIKQLKEKGLSPKHFNWDFQKIWKWLKEN